MASGYPVSVTQPGIVPVKVGAWPTAYPQLPLGIRSLVLSVIVMAGHTPAERWASGGNQPFPAQKIRPDGPIERSSAPAPCLSNTQHRGLPIPGAVRNPCNTGD